MSMLKNATRRLHQNQTKYPGADPEERLRFRGTDTEILPNSS